MTTIYTIGYEGTDIDRFIETLKVVGVDTLADVRAVPISRKKGFSKTSLMSRLALAGIHYRHFQGLGDPKEGREAARSGHHDDFRRIYSHHLAQVAVQKELHALVDEVRIGTVCMMCFERSPAGCHRSMIGAELQEQGITVFDLYGDLPRRYANIASSRQSRRLDQGLAAAE